jgi:hypothetical protein
VLNAGDSGVGLAVMPGKEAEKGSVSRKGREGDETEGKRDGKRGAGAVERRRGVGRRVDEGEIEEEEGGRKEEREARVLVVEARRGAERGRGCGIRIRVGRPTARSSMARATSGWLEWREWVCGPSDSGCVVLTGARATASAMKAGSRSASESEVEPSLSSSSSSSEEAEERYVSYGFEGDNSGVLAGLSGVVVGAGRGGDVRAVRAERSVNSKRRDARREERGGRAGSIGVCEVVVVRVDMVVVFERESARVVRSGARRGIIEVECVVWVRLVLYGIWYRLWRVYDIFCSNTGYSQYGGEPLAVRLSFFLVAHTNMISSRLSAQTLSSSQHEIDISRLSAPQFSSPEIFFLCAVPSNLQIIDSRTPRRERQVYKFPTPLPTIPPGAGSNAHTTHPHPHPQNMHHTGTTSTGTTL